MIEWFHHILRRITGVSTPLGGISWNPSPAKITTVPTFHEPIYITYPENNGLFSFLETNDGKIVFLDTHLDASVAIAEQFEIVEKENLDIGLISSGTFSGVPLPLPNQDGNLVTISFYFRDGHVLKCSAGGTGLVTVDINGFFEVSRTLHGGPTTAFHLKEQDAPLEARIELLNR
ncbi:MAG: hypothetical protein ABFD50_08455 [Smithella sp.]